MRETTPDCCTTDDEGLEHGRRFDFVLFGSLGVIVAVLALYFAGLNIPSIDHFAHTVLEFLGTMWWGIVLGIIGVGFMNKVPREYFQVLLGPGDNFSGLLRACFAGLLLDLCSHGILMIGAKLYERGASLAQVMTFLIASPWNSFSLTLILIALIGLKWTLVFIAGSVVIALLTGSIYILLARAGILPENPHKLQRIEGFSIRADMKERLKGFRFTPKFFMEILRGGMHEAQMLLRWLLLGIVIAAAVRTFVPPEAFAAWFGPTLFGLCMTLIMTTIIEVCSEGSTPIAAEILKSAQAPGNAFAFLMAGVSTDYTEMMVLRDATKSWKIALSLPAITVPQVLLLGFLINHFQ
ncbi:MAG: permease [Alphaproteobacteria bacterium]